MKVAPSEQVNDTHAARASKTPMVCPYCGESQPAADECRACRGLFEPLSRQATQNAMGPWRIRDEASPFRPPCSYATLLTLIKKGKITRDSVVSGPTTRQFWARAADVQGLSHLFHSCHNCRAQAHPSDSLCTDCGASFLAPEDRNTLGLAPIRPLTPAPAAPAPRPTHRPSTDPFHTPSLPPSLTQPDRPRHSRLPAIILITALAVAAVASGLAIYRWQRSSVPTSGAAPAVPAPEGDHPVSTP